MNNKELINAGHALAKAISNDTPLIEIAKMVSNLATHLDVQLARSNALAAENAGLKDAIDATIGWQQSTDPENVESVRMLVDVKTPDTDAFLAEVRASGIDAWIESLGDKWNGTTKGAERFAENLRKGVQL
ncbi:TPA: hypothetical protein I3785_001420 [Enterobacter cloacae]|nr:hypothetical protein [Enterobacter cloacae]HAS1072082.1 hypothetical protein [Enterobacter cloacae]